MVILGGSSSDKPSLHRLEDVCTVVTGYTLVDCLLRAVEALCTLMPWDTRFSGSFQWQVTSLSLGFLVLFSCRCTVEVLSKFNPKALRELYLVIIWWYFVGVVSKFCRNSVKILLESRDKALLCVSLVVFCWCSVKILSKFCQKSVRKLYLVVFCWRSIEILPKFFSWSWQCWIWSHGCQ